LEIESSIKAKFILQTKFEDFDQPLSLVVNRQAQQALLIFMPTKKNVDCCCKILILEIICLYHIVVSGNNANPTV
jgi:hypothetical protein